MNKSYINNKCKKFSKNFNFKLISCFLIAFMIIAQVIDVQRVFALQSNGSQNKISNIDGYRIISQNQIEILTDKPPVAPDRDQFKLYEGLDTSENGFWTPIMDAVLSKDTPNQTMTAAVASGLHMSTGGGYIITSMDGFFPGKTYTIVMSNTIVGGTKFTLGHTNSNKDVSFSFTYPNKLTTGKSGSISNSESSYTSAVAPTVSFMPGNNSDNVSLEGNVWFDVSVPVANYDQVLSGMVLKRNGEKVSYAPFTTPSNESNNFDCYAPVYNDDHTFFGFLLTQGSSTYYDFNWKPDSTYELSIPEIQTINGQTIAPQTLTFHTMNGDTPNKMSNITAEVSGENIQISWDADVAGPIGTEPGNLGWPAADGYNVYVSSEPYWNFVKLNSSPITGTSYTTTSLAAGLDPGGTYYFRVSPLAKGNDGVTEFEGGMYSAGGNPPTEVTAPYALPKANTLDISGSSTLYIPSGSTTANYTAIVKDQFSNVMTGENVAWSLESPVTGVSIDSSTGVLTIDNTASAGSITIAAIDGSAANSMVVNLKDTVYVTGVSLNKVSAAVHNFITYQLTATVSPDNATNQSVTWKSDNTEVATVSDTGLITTISPGTANITVTTADGSKTATCAVTVDSLIGVSGITLNKISDTLIVGDVDQLSDTITPDNASIKNVTWASDNTAVATVSNTGLVKAVSLGTANITATTEDGGKAATCAVTVTGKPTIISATTESQGSVIIAQFDKLMANGEYPNYSFTATVDGVTYHSTNAYPQYLDNTKLVVDFSDIIIKNGQKVTLNYTAGTVHAIDGTMLDSFSAQPVKNVVSPDVLNTATDTSGNKVIVTFNAKMSAVLPDAPGGFSISADDKGIPISAITLDPEDSTKIDLSLSAPIPAGKIVTLLYNQGTVADANSVLLSSFSKINVINKVPPAAPTVSSAATSGPAHIILTMNSSLNGITGDPSAFTVIGAASDPNVTAVTVSGKNVLLTLNTAIGNGEILTVNYNKTGTNNLTNGTEVDNFTGQPVTNSILADPTAPTFSSAVTNAQGKVITVAFDKAMAILQSAPAGFSVSVDGVDDLVIGAALNTTSTNIDLVLAQPVFNGQTITLVYTPGTVTSNDGGKLESFSGETVTNGVSALGYITTLAGKGGTSSDFVPATSSNLSVPKGVAVDSSGNIYIADIGSGRIREIAATTHTQFGISMTAGYIYTVAGSIELNVNFGDGNIATNARIPSPYSVAVDGNGNLYIADYNNNRIRKVDVNGIITNFAGNQYGSRGYTGDNGLATNALLSYPSDVTVDSAGNVYIADSYNHAIRKVDTNGIITTVAGVGRPGGYSGDGGPASSALMGAPTSVRVDRTGNIYFVDNYNVAREVAAADHTQFGISMKTGNIYTIAGTGSKGTTADGSLAINACFNDLEGIEIDRFGNVFLSEAGNDKVRVVNNSGVLSTVAGNGTHPNYYANPGDNKTATTANIYNNQKLAIDSTGNLYIADSDDFRLRLVRLTGTDATELAADKDSLNITYGSGDNANAVTKGIILPIGPTIYGTTVTWSSDNPSVIGNDGTVTRPDFYAGDAAVTLTATLTNGTLTDTKTFILTVTKQDKTDAEKLAEDKASLGITYGGTDSATSVTQGISLPQGPLTNGTLVTWTSSNTAVIGNDGTVIRPDWNEGDATVTMTANLTNGTASDTQTFTLIVPKNDKTDAEKLAEDKDALAITYGGTDSATSVTQNITLPSTLTNGTTVTWTSSNTAVIGNNGTVIRPDWNEGDATVTMTANLTNGTAADNKTFTLTVSKNHKTDAEKLAEDMDALAITYGGTDSVTNVTQNITLPSTLTNGTTVTWTSSNTAVIGNDGTVTRPEFGAGDAVVTMTAQLTNDTAADTMTFTMIVAKKLAAAPAAPSVTADNTANKIAGIDSTMEYSIDGGSWTKYVAEPDLSGNHTVNVRVAANAVTGAPAGAITVLKFTNNAASANTTDSSTLPKTGSPFDLYTLMVIGMSLLSAGMFITVKKRRRNNN